MQANEATNPPESPEADVELEGSAESDLAPPERSIHARSFSSEGMTEHAFEHVSDLPWRPKDEVLWIDLSGYEEDDLTDLANELELDSAGIRAALAPWQRPAVRAFANHAFMNATVIDIDLDELTVAASEIDCFVSERFVLTAHNEALPFIDEMVERAEANAATIATDPAYLLYILLDELIDDFASVAEELDDMIEQLETAALTSANANLLGALVRHKRFVYTVNRLIGQHAFVFHGLLRPDIPFVSGETVEGHFAELKERFLEVASTFDDARQEMLGVFDIYMSSEAHRTNGIIKILTMISLLLLPAGVLFGFFGTNFTRYPLYGAIGFGIMFALLATLTIGQLVVFRRRGWLA